MWWTALALAGPLADELAEIPDDLSLAEELALRVDVDQRARKADRGGEEAEAAWAEEVRAVDEANRAFVRSLVEGDWPTLSVHGEEASMHAWLLVQHADTDPELQQAALARLEALLADGEVAPKRVAYLHDRVMVNTEQPQRYGTQGRCDGALWSPRDLEDPDAVDALRAEVGLGPLGDYALRFDCDGNEAKAQAAYRDEDWEACADRYGEVVAVRDVAGAWFNGACCSAKAGRVDEALDRLDGALAAGFDDLQHLEWDPDLQLVRGTDRYNALVAEHRPSVVVRVDGRVELLHAMARLADFDEFHHAPDAHDYIQRLDRYLADHEDHPAVAKLTSLRRTQGVGFNALSALAFLLDDDVTPALRVPLDPFPHPIDDRLDTAETEAFVELLASFVQDVDWEGWRTRDADRRRKVEKAVGAAIAQEDPQAWFDASFPEQEPGSLLVVPELIAWTGNFAAALPPEHGGERLAVLSAMRWDDVGMVGGKPDLHVLVHEIAHSYANPYVDTAAADPLRKSNAKLFKKVADEMEALAYGAPEIMLYETMTRAVTTVYLRERHDARVVAGDAASNFAQSFFWVPEVADAVEKHRRADGALDLPAATDDVRAVLDRWRKKPRSAFVYAPHIPNRHEPVAVVVAPEAVDAVSAMAAKFWPEAEVVPAGPTDAPTPKGDATYYVTPDHPVAAAVLGELGMTFDADGVRGEGWAEEGADQLVLAAEHDGRRVVLYLAREAAALPKINGMFHGPYALSVGRAGDDVFHTDQP